MGAQKISNKFVHRKVKAFHFPVMLMGCSFTITAIHHEPQKAWDGIREGLKEIERIEQLVSSWSETSETSIINASAGISSVEVSAELFQLIERSIKVSQLTSGAFDISGTLARKYWKFDQSEIEMLPQNELFELRDLMDYRNIILDDNQTSVGLSKKGMMIGFGGIGKGYAAQKAKEVMMSFGIESGLVNASGDIMCWGHPPQGGNWKISIPKYSNKSESLFDLEIPNGAIATSGFQENYVLIDGEKHSHIVDPRIGLPSKKTNSVSVLCPNPEFADAMATALSVLGVEEGLYIIDQILGVEAIIVDMHDNIHSSKNINVTI